MGAEGYGFAPILTYNVVFIYCNENLKVDKCCIGRSNSNNFIQCFPGHSFLIKVRLQFLPKN